MWNKIAGVLIRQRFLWLLLLGIGTLFMGSHIPNVRLQYQFGGLLPATDSTAIAYEEFKSVFGTEGNVMVIGSELPPLQSAEAWRLGMGWRTRFEPWRWCGTPPMTAWTTRFWCH